MSPLKKWIVGPEESEEAFVKRIDNQVALSQKLGYHSISSCEEVWNFVKSAFLVEPDWIVFHYSNHKLSPWEGAASWTGDEGNWIQLRKAFKRGSFMRYTRNEVLLHEVIHSLRMAFDEPRFEEVLANAFAKKRWRRFLGPLFSSNKQVGLFCVSLCIAPFFFYAPLLYLGYRFGALTRDQRIFRRAYKAVLRTFPNLPPYALLIRLRDQEVVFFSKATKDEIETYLSQNKNSPRFSAIYTLYQK